AEQRLGEPQRGAAHALELRERQQRGGGLSALAGGERAPDFLERSERRARCGGERAPERRELLRRSSELGVLGRLAPLQLRGAAAARELIREAHEQRADVARVLARRRVVALLRLRD